MVRHIILFNKLLKTIIVTTTKIQRTQNGTVSFINYLLIMFHHYVAYCILLCLLEFLVILNSLVIIFYLFYCVIFTCMLLLILCKSLLL